VIPSSSRDSTTVRVGRRAEDIDNLFVDGILDVGTRSGPFAIQGLAHTLS